MLAVILAGGKGKRLRPLTKEIPKPMALINGKPFLEYQLLLLKSKGIKEILMCVSYLGQQIKEYFKDGSRWGLRIKYSREEKALGTGGALKNAERYLSSVFFVVYGDSYLDFDYKRALSDFKEKNKLGLVVVYDNKKDTFVKNNITLGSRGDILEYDKTGKNKNLRYVEAGVLIFKKEILSLIKAKQKVSLENEIFPKLIKMKELTGFKTSNRFYDIGTFERLKAAKKALK